MSWKKSFPWGRYTVWIYSKKLHIVIFNEQKISFFMKAADMRNDVTRLTK